MVVSYSFILTAVFCILVLHILFIRVIIFFVLVHVRVHNSMVWLKR